jgi:hypothetical protein
MVKFVGVVLAGMILIIGSGCGDSSTSADQTDATTPEQRIQDELGDQVQGTGNAGDLEVKAVHVGSNNARVTVQPPGGSFQGTSCGDLDDGAQAVFETIYNDAGWKGDATVVYVGGLVNEATGKEEPGANTAQFKITAEEASQIDWSDEDALSNIDWSTYRKFCHQASQ